MKHSTEGERSTSREARPFVSVVVPTRNRRSLLERAVVSILSQRYEGEIECLLVFDQSEPVLPLIDVPPRRTIRALANNRTAGAAGARNTGALAASGDILAFCDDDDEWLPDKLRLQLKALASNSHALAVSCGLYVFYRDAWSRRLRRRRWVTFSDLIRSRVIELNMSTLVLRREDFLSRVGLFDEAIPGSYGEDYEWFLRATQLGTVDIVPNALARIHWRRDARHPESWRTIIAALTYVLNKHPQLKRDRKGLARIYGQVAFAHSALSEREEARKWARRCLALDILQLRGYIAIVVSLGLIRSETFLHIANRFGRGLV